MCDPTSRPDSTDVCSSRSDADRLIVGVRRLRLHPGPMILSLPTPTRASRRRRRPQWHATGLRRPRWAASRRRGPLQRQHPVLPSHRGTSTPGIEDPGRIEFRSMPSVAGGVRSPRQGRVRPLVISIQRGPQCIFEEAVRRRDRQLTSRLSLAGENTIRRHVSFHCEQGIPLLEQRPPQRRPHPCQAASLGRVDTPPTEGHNPHDLYLAERAER